MPDAFRRPRLAVAILALVFAPSATAAAPPTILVKFKQSTGSAARIEARGDDALGRTANGVSIVRLAPGKSRRAEIAAYETRADVAYAEPNGLVHALALNPPNDPDFSNQWAFALTGALAGWALYPGTYGASTGATLAVLDTGVDATHPDLAGRVRTDLGASCLNLTPCVAGPAADDEGHGTHVGGIAGAATNNGVGVAGVAFSSPVIPVKVLDSTGIGNFSDVADGILWAAQHGARVINLSLGDGGYSQTVCDAASTAEHTYGALIVAAAGNKSSAASSAPAACPGAVGVAATDELDSPASFSNFGSPDVFPDPYGTCTGCTWQASYGYGRVDVNAALAAPPPLRPPAPPPPPPPLPPPPPPPPVLPVPNKPDTVAPFVRAYPVSGRRGRTVKLTYRVRDDRGRTTEQISVYRGRSRIARLGRTLRPTDSASIYWVPWTAPRRAMRGRFCVRARDGAGNAATSCASLRVR